MANEVEAKHKSYDLCCYCEQTGYAKHRLSKFKEIFSSVATVATARKLSEENFLLHLKECVLLYFTAFVAFQDAATSVAK